MSKALADTYGLDRDRVDAILRPLMAEDAQAVADAVNAHIVDPETGKWAPRPADLTRRLPRQAVAAWEPDSDTPSSLVEIPEWVTQAIGIRGSLRLYRSQCPDCCDTGWARYYYEPHPTGPRRRRRAWLSSEVLELGEGQFRALKLRCARNARCGCAAGQQVKMSDRSTTLARVRQVAAERREYELG